MILPEQQKWLDHLNNDDHVVIKPYDPRSVGIFKRVKKRILKIMGKNTIVEHRGATSYQMSGQDEIDIYIPVSPDKFDQSVHILKAEFGEPRSCYPLERARFRVMDEIKEHVDVFVINEQHAGWVNSEIFNKYLKSHPEAMESYRILKETGEGLSTKVYYTRKIEFINDILEKSKNE